MNASGSVSGPETGCSESRNAFCVPYMTKKLLILKYSIMICVIYQLF